MYRRIFQIFQPCYPIVKGDSDGCCLCRYHSAVLCAVRRLCYFFVRGETVMEDILVGIVAVCLIVYLFAALLRPDKF